MSDPHVPPPPPGHPTSSSGNKTLMLILSYLSLLAIIPLLTEKDDREVQWHAKHGLVLFFAFLSVSVVLTMLSFVLPFGASCFSGMLGMVLWLAYVIVTIVAIVKAVNGQRFTLPVISDFVNKF